MDPVELVIMVAVAILGAAGIRLYKWVEKALREKFIGDIGIQLEKRFAVKWDEQLARHIDPVRSELQSLGVKVEENNRQVDRTNRKVDDTRAHLAHQMPPEGENWANGSDNLYQSVGWMVGTLYSILEHLGIRQKGDPDDPR